MKRLLGIAAATLIVASPCASALAQSNDARIAEAVKPLPEDLKSGATVVAYDEKTCERMVLRQGTNFVECQPKAKDGFVRCYNKVLAPRRDFFARSLAAAAQGFRGV